MLELLLSYASNLELADEDGRTALLHAICTEIADHGPKLIQAGCKVDVVDKYGESALDLAISNGKFDQAKLLIEKGVDINRRAEGGWTPLMQATSQDDARAVAFLLENGADKWIKNDCEECALDLVSNSIGEVAGLLAKDDLGSGKTTEYSE